MRTSWAMLTNLLISWVVFGPVVLGCRSPLNASYHLGMIHSSVSLNLVSKLKNLRRRWLVFFRIFYRFWQAVKVAHCYFLEGCCFY